MADPMAAAQVDQLTRNCAEFGIPLHGLGSPGQGIVHVIGPQLGLTQPGMTIVCGDSHTATHGAFGALAFGIGTSEVEMVLATQTLLQRDPKTYEVRVDGRLDPGVSAKDIILALIARIGIGGGTGPRLRVHRRRHPGPDDGAADDDLQHEHRGRRPGRPDRAGRHDVRVRRGSDPCSAGRRLGRRTSPTGGRSRPTMARPTTDRSRSTPSALEPMVTYGTNPGMGIPITSRVPAPQAQADPGRATRARARPRVHGPHSPARRSSARRSTSSSSARARTAGSATCASRPRSSRIARSPTASG